MSYLFAAQTSDNVNDANPIVKLPSRGYCGPDSFIKGEIRRNALDRNSRFSAFHAIPYAFPPIGPMRFRKPYPYSPSYGLETNPFDATNPSNIKACPQKATDFSIHKESKDEDCLYLSVYTPKLSFNSVNDTLFPVLFWIHGGFFEHGGGMYYAYGPDRFMKDGDIVMVSINYRLGLLGFMTLGNEYIPGNMGLWDQRLALEWVKQNIDAFGGNPDMVTIMGESGGSSSVIFQLLNEKMHHTNRDLFHRVIAQSGTSLSPACHELPEERAKK